MKRIFLIVTVLMMTGLMSFADCILNSTEFYKAYLDEPLVNAAHQNKYKFTDEHKKYLIDDNNPLAVRMAIINAFDWDHNGDYYGQLLDYLMRQSNSSSTDETLDKASAEQVMVLAYLKAMDDIDEEVLTVQLVDRAMNKPHKKSQSFMVPATLIKAQVMDYNGQSEKIFPMVQKNILQSPIRDMSQEAIGIIMEYMLYFKD